MAVTLITAIATGFGAAAAVAGMTFSWAAFAISAGFSLVTRALTPKPDLGVQMGGQSVMTREAAQSRKIIYGRTRVGANVVYLESTGADKKYLWLVGAVAAHEIDAYEEVWFNDEKVWDSTQGYYNNWGSRVEIRFFTGDQTVSDNATDSTAISPRTDNLVNASNNKWTTDHKLLDTAYMVIRLEHDVDKFSSGLPNISTVIRGKKVLHTAEVTAGDFLLNKKYKITQVGTTNFVSLGAASNTVGVEFIATNVGSGTGKANIIDWSQNNALCLYDYLRDTKYGLGESVDNILTSSVTAAKEVCDQPIQIKPVADNITQPRYTINGVVDTASTLKSNIEIITGSMAGRLVYSGGKFEIHAGQYVAPAFTVDASQIVGDITVQTKQSRRNVFNGVKGVFLSEDDNYILADYPAQISSTFAVQDGDPIYLDMALPFTTNNIRAQRLAKLALLRSRQEEAITIPCNLSALRFKIGDNISVNYTDFGYVAKIFEVVGYSLSLGSDGQIIVNVQAIETAANIWDWATSDEEVFLDGGTVELYDGKVAEPPASVAVAGDTFIAADGTTNSFFNVTWPTSVDAFVDRYVVEWAITEAAGSLVVGKSYEILTAGNTAWTGIGAASNTVGVIFTATGVGAGTGIAVRSDNYLSQETRLSPFVITNVKSLKVYYVRVKAINELGVSSVYKAASQTVAIDTTPPSVPTNPAAHGEYRQITVSWTPPTQTDFEEVDVFRAESLADMQSESGTYKDVGSDITAFIDTDLDTPREYFYKIRSSDRSKNKSDFTAIISATSKNVNITAPDNPDVIIYDGESGLPPSVTSGRTTLDANTSTFYLKQDYKEHVEMRLTYPLGALTSGSISGQANAINAVMAEFKFQVFYAPISSPSNFTQFGEGPNKDVRSFRKTTTSNLAGSYYIKTTNLGSGNFKAELQKRAEVNALFPALGGRDLGAVDDNYNLTKRILQYDFPAGEYVFKIVVVAVNGSHSPYPSTGSPSIALKRKVDPIGFQQVKKTGYSVAFEPFYQPITVFRDEESNEIVRLSEGADTLELSAINSSGVPVQAFVGGGASSTTTWGARIQFDDDLDTYDNGGIGQYQIGIDKSGTHLSLGTAPSSGGYPRGLNPSLSELRISSGRTDILGSLFLNGVAVGTGSGSISGVTAGTNLNGGGTSGTVTLNLDSTISGNHTFSDNLIIGGNLTVNGTTTTVDTDNLNVKDKNITLNYSTGDSSATANGAGITIQDAVDASNNATILWDSSNDKFDFSHKLTTPSLDVGGNIAVTGTVDGIDIAARDAVLTTTTNTANAALPKAGGTLTGNLSLGDNVKAMFGAGSDLQIYHDGSDSYIDDAGAGRLWVRTSELRVQKYTGEAIIKGVADGAVTLYHNNAEKLATTSTGISVTGSVTSTGLTVNSGGANVATSFISTDGTVGIKLQDNSGNVELSATGSTFNIQPSGGVSHFSVSTNVSGTGSGGAFIPSGKRLGFDQSGVRSWTQYAAGGNLLFASGDGNGAIQANNFTASTYAIGTTTVIDSGRNITMGHSLTVAGDGGSNYTANHIRFMSHNTARGAGHFMMDDVGANTWYTGTAYADGFDNWGVHYKAANEDEETAHTQRRVFSVSKVGNATFAGAITASSVNASGGFLNGSNGGIRIHTSGTKFFNVTAANSSRDNIMDIGAADARFKNLHLGGTISSGNITAGLIGAGGAPVSGYALYARGSIAQDSGSISAFGNVSAGMGYVKAASGGSGGYYVASQQVIDGSRNLTNIATINSGAITTSGNVSVGGSAYTTNADLNLLGDGLAIKNDKNGSNNNWSYIQNTDTGSASNLLFTTGAGSALTLNHDKSATFASTISSTAIRHANSNAQVVDLDHNDYLMLNDPEGINRILIGDSADRSTYIRNTNIYLQDASGVTNFQTNSSNTSIARGTLRMGTTTVIDGNRDITANAVRSSALSAKNSRISSGQEFPVGHYSSADTVFEIDPTWTQAQLAYYFGLATSSINWSADATAPDGYAIRLTGGANVGGVYGSGFPYIPVGTDDIFYMECWIKNVGTNQRHYMGSNEFNQNFSSLGGNPGSYGYWVMSNTNPTSSWTKVSGYITGFGNSVGQFESGTKYWTPMALFNYGAGSGTRACDISGWKVVKVNHCGNRTFEGSVSAGSATFAASGTGAVGLEIDSDVGTSITLGNDGTFGTTGGGRYTTLGFSGTSNGHNRIFALNTQSDGIYICSATSRSIYFRTNGGGANTFSMTAAGDFQANNITVIDASRNLTNIGTISSGAITVNSENHLNVGGTSHAYSSVSQGYMAGFKSSSNSTQTFISIARHNKTLDSQDLVIGVDSTAAYFWNRENTALKFGSNNSTKMTLSNTGLLTTVSGYQVNGTTVISSGRAITNCTGITLTGGSISSYGSVTAGLGSFLVGTRGKMGQVSNDLFVCSTTSDHSGLRFANGAIHPTDHTGAQSDSAQIDLGASSYRFNDIFARNGTINTSDINEKQDVEVLSAAEQRVAVAAKGLLRKFRWKDAVSEKGDGARIHFGIIAQDLQAAFVAEGLDAGRYGMFTSDTWNEDGVDQTRMGVRYSELLAFIISAI